MADTGPIRACRAVWRDRQGIATVEFALVGSVLVTLMLGAYQIGNGIQEITQMQQALFAGAVYAVSYPTQTGAAGSANDGIVLAIAAALPASMDYPVTIVTPSVLSVSSPRTIQLQATIQDPWLVALTAPATTYTVTYVVRVQ